MKLFEKYDIKNRYRKITFYLIFFLLCYVIIQIPIFADDKFIFTDSIIPGMKGVGKTVFSGTEIEEFDVQVIDVISGNSINDSYILVRLSGNQIDENGGISAGMSGTPVYLDGKLAGAISHAWEMSEHNLCLVTPIDRMLKLFDYTICDNFDRLSCLPDFQTITVSLNNDLVKKIIKYTYVSENRSICEYAELSEINFRKIRSPLLINGLNGRAQELIKRKFNENEAFVIKNIPDLYSTETELRISYGNNKIEPGSAIGVQLSAGDASIMTIGTATYCKDVKVLAFGHPFMHLGNVSYLFSAVYIYHSFPSFVMPFKLGFPYQLLGEVIQDRNSGILAKLNKFPKVVSCKMEVCDSNKNTAIKSGAKIVQQNDILQSVINALLIQTIDHAIDRIGQGTALVKLELKKSQNEENILYENTFFSKDDIAVQCSKDFEELIGLMINNYTEHIDLSEIRIDIKITEQNQSAIIKSIKTDREEYYPGESIQVEAVLKPFREPDKIEVMNIELPEDIPEGEIILIVNGGSSREEVDENIFTQDKKNDLIEGWDGIKKHFEEKVKNNQIVFDLVTVNKSKKSGSLIEKEEKNVENDYKHILDTEYIVEGQHEIFLSIVDRNNENKDKDNE